MRLIADNFRINTGTSGSGTERMRVDASGNVGIGTTSPSSRLSVSNSAGGNVASFTNTSSADFQINLTSGVSLLTPSTGILAFGTSSTERMRITSDGNVGLGTTTPNQGGGTRAITLDAPIAGNYSAFELMTGGTLRAKFIGNSSQTYLGTSTATPLVLVTADTERMRIDSAGHAFFSGNYSVLYPGSGNTTTGIFLESSGQLSCSRDNTVVARFNRNSTDGTLLSLSRQGTEIGTVSVSSGTVSYNAFAGSHWSQLSDGSKPDILRGTVLDSINELVQWPDEPTTERLCKVKVSDMAGSKKVYGVFMDWDNDWTATNDMYVTAVGAFICRVNASVTVQEGDLLESNGDGTARVQADDLIRSSTIGKVTCTEKTHQYDDGSYCVPTVLYCG